MYQLFEKRQSSQSFSSRPRSALFPLLAVARANHCHPQLNDRILNNDLLRHLAKTQTDPEPGIRTNTCILLGRLSRHLQPGTNRKVLVPAFARALRDPFVHARIAGLMALMATADVYEKEDLAGKVIPAMSICLVDREK